MRIRARDVILAVAPPDRDQRAERAGGRVEQLVPIEEGALEVQLRVGGERLLARVTRRSGEALGLAPGREVFAVIKTVAIDGAAFPGGARPPISRRNEMFDS